MQVQAVLKFELCTNEGLLLGRKLCNSRPVSSFRTVCFHTRMPTPPGCLRAQFRENFSFQSSLSAGLFVINEWAQTKCKSAHRLCCLLALSVSGSYAVPWFWFAMEVSIPLVIWNCWRRLLGRVERMKPDIGQMQKTSVNAQRASSVCF